MSIVFFSSFPFPPPHRHNLQSGLPKSLSEDSFQVAFFSSSSSFSSSSFVEETTNNKIQQKTTKEKFADMPNFHADRRWWCCWCWWWLIRRRRWYRGGNISKNVTAHTVYFHSFNSIQTEKMLPLCTEEHFITTVNFFPFVFVGCCCCWLNRVPCGDDHHDNDDKPTTTTSSSSSSFCAEVVASSLALFLTAFSFHFISFLIFVISFFHLYLHHFIICAHRTNTHTHTHTQISNVAFSVSAIVLKSRKNKFYRILLFLCVCVCVCALTYVLDKREKSPNK